MKVLFVCFHPVDPLVVINSAKKIEKKNGKVLFIIIEKEGIIKNIVSSYGFNNKVIGINKKSVIGKILFTFKIVSKLLIIINRFKPDIVFSPTSPYTSLACAISKAKSICWVDTETATINIKYSHWHVNSILLPFSFYNKLPYKNIIKYNGYKELAYLHPNNFKPNKDVLTELNLNESDKIVLMRFSALNAMHDIGLKSEALVNDDKILEFIKNIENKYNAKVFISVTERNLDNRFEKYKLTIAPEKYIHLLSFCSLYIGEGTTTASEAGVLGVPWVNIQKTKRGYLIDQENTYGLGIRTDDIDFAFRKAEEYLSDKNIKITWQKKRDKLLSDKIDVSAFLSWFIENYPESHKIMKENPDYQNKFK